MMSVRWGGPREEEGRIIFRWEGTREEEDRLIFKWGGRREVGLKNYSQVGKAE